MPAKDSISALVLWEGGTRGSGDVTLAFLDEALRRGWPTAEIHTGGAPVQARSAGER